MSIRLVAARGGRTQFPDQSTSTLRSGWRVGRATTKAARVRWPPVLISAGPLTLTASSRSRPRSRACAYDNAGGIRTGDRAAVREPDVGLGAVAAQPTPARSAD